MKSMNGKNKKNVIITNKWKRIITKFEGFSYDY